MSSCGGLDAYGTRVLIPFPGGLVELYVSKQVAEEQSLVEFVSAQCNNYAVEGMASQGSHMACPSQQPDQPTMDGHGFSSFDRIRLNNSPMNFIQRDDAYYDAINNTFGDTEDNIDAKDFEREINNGRADSISDCSDQNDDDEDNGKCGRKKGGKGGQAKNLEAERKRRKKLSDRLLTLRSLVPKITKLDKASVLGDAISFVKDLQRQQKELQDELEEPTDDEGYAEQSILIQESSNGECSSGIRMNGASTSHSNALMQVNEDDEAQQKGQMEPQVEVAQIDANKFFVKIFCEYKTGGFVRLMEALNSLGLVVTNANVTRVLSLVSNVFQVEKEETNGLIQADYLRDSLLELSRNARWPDSVHASNACNNLDFSQQHHPMQDSPYQL